MKRFDNSVSDYISHKVIMGLISAVLTCLVVFLATTASSAQEALSGELVVEGTGDSQEMLRAIARRFQVLHPGVSVKVPDSVGSSGGIRRLARGEADLARVARPLKADELKYGLTYSIFAKAPVVLALNPGVEGVEDLTYEQIADIFSGKISNWEQLGDQRRKIYPVYRELGDSSRDVLERHISGFKDIRPPRGGTFYTTPETVEMIKVHEDTIGYVPLPEAKSAGLIIIKVNGVYPSHENIAAGKYELVSTLAIVYKKENLTLLSKAFLDFIYGPEGRIIIKEYGCVPVGRADQDKQRSR